MRRFRLYAILCLAAASILAAEEVDTFIFDVEGLVRYESSHAVKEALQSFTHIQYVGADLSTKQVTVDAKPGKYTAEQLIQAIDSAEDSQGPMKAKLNEGPGSGDDST